MSEEAMENGWGHTVLCPKCRKVHFSETAPVDEYIDCECGFSFYAFVDHGLRIIMTADEAGYEPVARAMRRFVISTGRCQDIPYELYCPLEGDDLYEMKVQERDLDGELMEILEEYQMSAFGECFLTKDVIDAVCETFQKGNDVELENHQDKVKVKEMKVRNVPKQKTQHHARLLSYSSRIQNMAATGGILKVSQGATRYQA
ncbi:MAG: hypothetical protein J6A79_14795 [Clostridia bacterium]|nr:hypothetical protein [Clostridia bacterium]